MNVLAFDQDSSNIGVIIARFPDAYKQPEIVYNETWKLKPKTLHEVIAFEMETLWNEISGAVSASSKCCIHYAVREAAFFNPKTPGGCLPVERIGGIIEALVYEHFDLETASVLASTWRKEVFGHGRMRREEAKKTALTWAAAIDKRIVCLHQAEALGMACWMKEQKKNEYWRDG